MSLERLKKLAEKRKHQSEKRFVFVHAEMKRTQKYYLAWNILDETFTKWIENPKVTIKQKNVLIRCRNMALLLRAEIETTNPNSNHYDFNFWNDLNVQKEKEAKELKRLLLVGRKKIEELKEINQIQFKTIEAMKAEIKYYEKENN